MDFRLNRPHKVPGYLKERVQAACNVLSMKDFDKKFVRSFMADGLDIKEIGLYADDILKHKPWFNGQ